MSTSSKSSQSSTLSLPSLLLPRGLYSGVEKRVRAFPPFLPLCPSSFSSKSPLLHLFICFCKVTGRVVGPLSIYLEGRSHRTVGPIDRHSRDEPLCQVRVFEVLGGISRNKPGGEGKGVVETVCFRTQKLVPFMCSMPGDCLPCHRRRLRWPNPSGCFCRSVGCACTGRGAKAA